MYRAAIALMEHFGYIRPSWNHGRLLSALRQRMVRERNILETTDIEHLIIAYDLRLSADYKDTWISPNDAQEAIIIAENFITTLREVMEHETE